MTKNKVSTQQHVEDIFNEVQIESPKKQVAKKAVVEDDDPFSDTNPIVVNKNGKKPNPRPSREETEFRDLTLNEYILKRFEEKIVFDRKLNVPQAVKITGLSANFDVTLDIAKGLVSLIKKADGSITPYPFDKLYQKLFSGENPTNKLNELNEMRIMEYESAYPASKYDVPTTILGKIDDLAPVDEFFDADEPFEATIDDLPDNMLSDSASSVKPSVTAEEFMEATVNNLDNALDTITETKTKGRGRPKATKQQTNEAPIEVEQKQVETDVDNKSQSGAPTPTEIDDTTKLIIIIDELFSIISRRLSKDLAKFRDTNSKA